MILRLKSGVTVDQIQDLAEKEKAFIINKPDGVLLVNSSSVKEVPTSLSSFVDEAFTFDSDIQLASRDFLKETRTISFGKTTIGGNTGNTVLIGGPCSVESEEQIEQSANLLTGMGLNVLRGGCYKPRTSPYSFQGLGLEGLKLLAKMREEHGLSVITEVRDATHIDEVIEYTDVIQIGAKAMYDQGILRRCAQARKPVMIKRGFGSTLQETVQAAEFMLSGGNDDVILCERGLRTFETKTRFTLDLCGVAYIKEYTNLPVILDPSHAMGFAYGVPDLSKACVAMGVDGLIVEVHPNPKVAKSDASQQLNHEQFKQLHKELIPVATAVGKTII